MSIAPIETVYQGYKFRSKLEARWALFFDLVSVAWDYEPDGYDLGALGWYLPDFYLSDFDTFIEIKPKTGDKEKVTAQLKALTALTGSAAWGLFGDPYDHQWLYLHLSTGENTDFGGRIKPAGWHDEFSGMQISFVRLNDGEIRPCPSNGEEKEWMAFGNKKEKLEARQARFDHGQTPKHLKASSLKQKENAVEVLVRLREMLKR